MSLELLWQVLGVAFREEKERAVRAAWDLAESPKNEVTSFWYARETPVVPRITGDGKMDKTSLSLRVYSSRSPVKQRLPHRGAVW